MGRQEEGNSLIIEVVKACPGDQATLQAATMYYRETGDGMHVGMEWRVLCYIFCRCRKYFCVRTPIPPSLPPSFFFLEQKVVDLYSRAAEQYPGNQEILTHLFMAFVRVGNYHKQQQVIIHETFSGLLIEVQWNSQARHL